MASQPPQPSQPTSSSEQRQPSKLPRSTSSSPNPKSFGNRISNRNSHLPPTPASSRHNARVRKKSRLEPVVEGDAHLLREIHEPPPGDVIPAASPTNTIDASDVDNGSSVRRRASSTALNKQRSLYFERAFGAGRAASDLGSSARDKAVVLAEVKTNVFVSFILFLPFIFLV